MATAAAVSRWMEAQPGIAAGTGANFREMDVDGAMLLELDDECLEELGVAGADTRGAILAAIAHLGE